MNDLKKQTVYFPLLFFHFFFKKKLISLRENNYTIIRIIKSIFLLKGKFFMMFLKTYIYPLISQNSFFLFNKYIYSYKEHFLLLLGRYSQNNFI